MEPRLTDEQLEAALNGELDPALVDHPVASFFRDGVAAFEAVQPAAPNAAMLEFFAAQADKGKDSQASNGGVLGSESNSTVVRGNFGSGAELHSTTDIDDVPIIQSASVIEPATSETKQEFDLSGETERGTDSRSDEDIFRPAIKPVGEDRSQWAPVIEPVFDEEREFPENPYELTNHSDRVPDAEVYWLDADRTGPADIEPEISESHTPRLLAGRRAAVLAAVVAAIVGGAQATGTMDLLPRRVVDMAAGHDGTLNEGRKPTDPPPEEIGDSDDDHTEPEGQDTPPDLDVDDAEPKKEKPNLRPVKRPNQNDNRGETI